VRRGRPALARPFLDFHDYDGDEVSPRAATIVVHEVLTPSSPEKPYIAPRAGLPI
jgi:hypothetical protein